MANPFPGMNPWLEAPDVWGGFHSRIINASVELLLPQLRPFGYFADAGERVWVEESQRDVLPDAAIIELPQRLPANEPSAVVLEADEPVRVRTMRSEFREPFLEILDARGRQLITGAEFVSPTNKSDTKGRRLYQRKRRELRRASVNIVEVDLLRSGRHVLKVPLGVAERLRPWDYLVCVERAESDVFELYPIPLRNRLPRIHIPLKPGDADVVLDLQAALSRAYQSGPYPDRLDYDHDPDPSLSAEHAAWADGILRAVGLRGATTG